MTTYDRSFDTKGTSSVIEAVYYNTERKELFVELTRSTFYGDPVIAGYEDVPENVFTALELENSNKLAGKDGSVGHYWNKWIKPLFKGLDTNGLELVPADESDEGFTAASSAPAASPAASLATDDGELATYVVHFLDKRGLGTVAVEAEDGEDALDRFEQIAELGGWDDAQVVAITLFLVKV